MLVALTSRGWHEREADVQLPWVGEIMQHIVRGPPAHLSAHISKPFTSSSFLRFLQPQSFEEYYTAPAYFSLGTRTLDHS